MFGFSTAKLPVSEEDRLWVDDAFRRLIALLGKQKMLDARVMSPTAEDFPDRFDGSEESLQFMFNRVANCMGVKPDTVELHVFSDATESTLESIPFAERRTSSPGGFYAHSEDGKKLVAVHQKQLKDPLSLVAVLAHELGHVILLGGGLVERNSEDMEPLNDLLTVFLGFGVFNANAAFQFSQFTSTQSQGWSTRSLGYLPEQVWGYALARFALEREEEKPEWSKFLATSVRSYFKSSMKWLRANASRPLTNE